MIKTEIFSAKWEHKKGKLFVYFSELHIEDDPTSIFLSAKALTSLQKLYGRIPKIYGKGNDAKKLWDLLKTMGKEELSTNSMGKGAIDQLIILDRSIDVMSVLATQLTYEGLIGMNGFWNFLLFLLSYKYFFKFIR